MAPKKDAKAEETSEAEITRMVEKAKELVAECKNLEDKNKTIEGWGKFCRRCTADQAAQEKRLEARKSGKADDQGVGNLLLHSAIAQLVGAHPVTAVLKNVSAGSFGRISVDAVTAMKDDRPVWIKCIDRMPVATDFREIEEAAWTWLALARQLLHHGMEPLVCFRFFAGVPEALSNRLTDLGVDVGEGIATPKPSEAKPMETINLDVTTLTALVSNLAHGRIGFEFEDKTLEQQAEEEVKKPILTQLAVLLAGKELRCAAGPLATFRDLIELSAGPEESKRAKRVLEVVKESEASALEPAKYDLQKSKCVDERLLEVLGVGVEHSIPTVMANDEAVKELASRAAGIHVLGHMVRELTEKKEADEAEECDRKHSIHALERQKLFDAILAGPKDAAEPKPKKPKLSEAEKQKMIDAGMELSDEDESDEEDGAPQVAQNDAEDVDDKIQCNHASTNYFNTLDAFYALHDANEADEELFSICSTAMEALHETCTSVFSGSQWKVPHTDITPDVKLEQFGSVVQDTALLSSDLNVRMSFVQFEVEEKTKQLKYLEGIAAATGDLFKVVEMCKKDRIPALKLLFKDKQEVFLTMGDELEDGAEVDNVIQTLLSASMDDGALRFIRLVKVFAKAHGLIDDNNGFMNSLSWVFLGIAFLQKEACLPCLNLFVENADEAMQNLWPVRLSASILARFFGFVERCGDKNYTVSVATAKHQPSESRAASCIMFVEHPSNSTLNLAASLTKDGMRKTAELCRKARHILYNNADMEMVMQIFDADVLASMKEKRRDRDRSEDRRRDDRRGRSNERERHRDDDRRKDKREMCGDFKKGDCRRGENCKYSHDDGSRGGKAEDKYGRGKWVDKKDDWKDDNSQWNDSSQQAGGAWSSKSNWSGNDQWGGNKAAATAPARPPFITPAAQSPMAARMMGGGTLTSVLAAVDLQPFEAAIRQLGVETPADLKYVTETDLGAMRMSLIQRRKFEGIRTNVRPGAPLAPVRAVPQIIPRAVPTLGMPAKGYGKSATLTPVASAYAPAAAGARFGQAGIAQRPPAVAAVRFGQAGAGQAQTQSWQHEDVVKAAQKRLLDNGHKKLYWEEVAKLKRDFRLSEHVELGLKLLEPNKLNMLLRGSGDLNRMLQLFPDKDKLVRSLIAKQDTYVDNLVKHLESKETQQKGAKPGMKGGMAMSSKGMGKGIQAARGSEDRSRTPNQFGRR